MREKLLLQLMALQSAAAQVDTGQMQLRGWQAGRPLASCQVTVMGQ